MVEYQRIEIMGWEPLGGVFEPIHATASNQLQVYDPVVDGKVDTLLTLHNVPAADSADNVHMRDVIGNKTDTVAGNSLIGYTKLLVTLHNTPAIDSADDNQMRDVIGRKSDTVAGTSLMSYAKVTNASTVTISTDVTLVYNRIGAPVGASISADIAAITISDDVPAQDSATNLKMRDVIGNKTDTVAGSSLISWNRLINTNLATVDGKVDTINTNVATLLTLHNVATFNSAANSYMRDVIGNKTDNVAGSSLIAQSKVIIAHFAVPVVDAVTNATIRDLTGNKNDTVAGTSLMSYAKKMIPWFSAIYRLSKTYYRAFFHDTAVPDGWTERIDGGASITYQSTYHGVPLLSTGATANNNVAFYKDGRGFPGMHTAALANVFYPATTWYVEFYMYVAAFAELSTFTGFGFVKNPPADTVLTNDSIGIRWTGSAWEAYSDNSGVETTDLISLTANTHYTVLFEFSAGHFKVYLNGVEQADITSNFHTASDTYFQAKIVTISDTDSSMNFGLYREWFE